jgi:DNA-binding winged helix-turn-helix (wHTH) protein/TolB-like protein
MEIRSFHFGIFEFDVVSRQLRRDGVTVSLQAQPAQVLSCLLQRAGQVVSREELRAAVWGAETFVDFDRGLNFCIAQIRSALRDDSTQPVYIRTIPKQGYQFIAPVREAPGSLIGEPAPLPPSPTETRRGVSIRAFALVVGVLSLLCLAAGIWLMLGRPGRSVPIVAVLRFDNETGNPSLGQFSDALTDNTVEQLTTQSRGRYSVIGNARILRVPREQRDLQAIASSLHASYVVLGQIQANTSPAENGQVRILVHLIHLPEQTHVWVARMDRTLTDQLGLESEAARKIADEFSGRVVTSPVRRASPPSATR